MKIQTETVRCSSAVKMTMLHKIRQPVLAPRRERWLEQMLRVAVCCILAVDCRVIFLFPKWIYFLLSLSRLFFIYPRCQKHIFNRKHGGLKRTKVNLHLHQDICSIIDTTT